MLYEKGKPLAPKAEWFGTGPNQWHSWMVLTEAGQWHHVTHVKGFTSEGWIDRGFYETFRWSMKYIVQVFPVCLYVPIPVEWSVVGI